MTTHSQLMKVLPLHTSPEHVNLARDRIDTIRTIEHVLKHGVTRQRVATTREVARARSALARTIKYCEDTALRAYLVRRPTEKGGIFEQFGADKMNKQIGAMRDLKARIERALKAKTPVRGRPSPNWHLYLDELCSLFKSIRGRAPTFHYTGSTPSEGTRFVVGMLALAGVRVGARAVIAHLASPRTRK